MNELRITQEWVRADLGDDFNTTVTVRCEQPPPKPPFDTAHTFVGEFPEPWVLEFDGKAVCTLRHEHANSDTTTTTNCPIGVGVNFTESSVVDCNYSTAFFNVTEVPTTTHVGNAVLFVLVLAVGLVALKKLF